MRNERYERTVKDSSGKLLHMTITNNIGRKFYCINKNCLLCRHPGLILENKGIRAV